MKNYFSLILILIVLPALTVVFYTYSFADEVDRIFLTISTFLYSIFAGFFISRQASRFNHVREAVTKFDGLMSNIYRTSGHISKELQTAIAEVITQRYEQIFSSGQWNYHLTHPSTTLSSIHALLDVHINEKEVTKISNQAIGAVVKNLATAQDTRKRLIALSRENVPFDQWILIIFFVLMLIGTVSAIPSQAVFFPSLLKAAFIISVLSVMYILYRLNNLMYTEKIMGEESARDVMSIIEGTK